MGRPRIMPTLNLRCEWCKKLFEWRPLSVWHMTKRPATCGTNCQGKLSSWKRNRKV